MISATGSTYADKFPGGFGAGAGVQTTLGDDVEAADAAVAAAEVRTGEPTELTVERTELRSGPVLATKVLRTGVCGLSAGVFSLEPLAGPPRRRYRLLRKLASVSRFLRFMRTLYERTGNMAPVVEPKTAPRTQRLIKRHRNDRSAMDPLARRSAGEQTPNPL